jgi:AraC-like DNA-binding protein
VRIGDVAVRPASAAVGEVEREDRFLLVLPTAGVFALHGSPRRQSVVTASQAVLVPADTPYRVGFPGALGDHALTLRLSAQTLEVALPGGARRRSARTLLGFKTLLSPSAMLARNLFWHRLLARDIDALGAEEFGLRLFRAALQAADFGDMADDDDAHGRASRRRRIERVKEAVAVEPDRKWSLDQLAAIACVSPYHLARMFREATGTSIHQFLLRLRLGLALRRLLASEADLATIASDLGFSSHSHFTARFRVLFGTTPTELRRDGGEVERLRALLA